jgi:hypothetical protein
MRKRGCADATHAICCVDRNFGWMRIVVGGCAGQAARSASGAGDAGYASNASNASDAGCDSVSCDPRNA